MKYLIGLLIVLFMGSTSAQDDPVIMTVDGEKVTKSEFEQIFWKNKKENVTNKEELDEYVDLFTKFKLKVRAAEEAGLDTTKKFKREFEGYKIQLQKPYLIDTTLNETLLKEAYYRSINELRASHILFSVKEGATAKDTAAAYNKAMQVHNDIIKGKITFEEAAIKYSQDPSVKVNKGDLGFFSAFRMVYAFEDAAYNTEIGEISKPFRTKFGYHLVKPTETRKSRGKVKVAHIMVRVAKDADATTVENAEKKINEIYEKAKAGEDFGTLVRDFSDDRNSVRKKGVLAWVEPGKYYPEFEETAFNLSKDGEISKPVRTPAGFHILKRIEYRAPGDFESMRLELKNKIQKDPRRSAKTKNSFIEKLKKEYGFVVNQAAKEDLYKKLTVKFLSNDPNYGSLRNKKQTELFSFHGQVKTVNDFVDFLESVHNYQLGQKAEKYVDLKFDRFVDQALTDFERTQLADKYPAYRMLLKEYRDGILLFEINDQKVWSYALKDSVGLREFYESNKNNYMWKERADVRVFSSTDKKVAKKAYKLAKKGKIKSDSIVNLLNASSQLNVSFESGRFETAEYDLLNKIDWKKGVNKPKMIDDKYVVLYVDKVYPAAPKELNEAKGMFTAEYQNFLEDKWVRELEEKYPVEINREVLYSIKEKP